MEYITNDDRVFKFLELYVYDSIILIIIMSIISYILIVLRNKVFDIYYRKKFELIYKPQSLIKLYKRYKKLYNFFSICQNNLVGIKYYEEKNVVYQTLLDESQFIKIIKLILSYFISSKFAITNIIITLCVYLVLYPNDLDIKQLIFINYFELYNNLRSQVDWVLKIIPSVILVISIFYVGYYTSTKAKYRAAIKLANKENFKDIINIHRALYIEVANLIYYGSRNINRAVEMVYDESRNYAIKDMIVDFRMKKISSQIYDIEKNKITWRWDEIGRYPGYLTDLPEGFEEIECLNNIKKILDKAVQDNKYKELIKIAIFHHHGGNFTKIMLNEIDKLDEIMFTKSGIEKIIETKGNSYEYKKLKNISFTQENYKDYETEIIKESNKFSKLIDDYIVTGIETLVDLTYYVNFMDNLLNKKHFRDLLGALAGYKE
ncbi:hypothetical protein [Clostridium butyricum]|uniref:Uncharacterized protein n=1 Tax=Clostridium butyricum TaxID=1492 RepID=A0A2S7F6F7_CLOBU|nr:hypothetical protein [Clostridium butyricum]KHD13508.1 hypothetical protein OA81_20360 [Clostridium butyricum]PPV12410.1 hypothetical protein AWN73_18820 [Clostridium butyricum]